MITGLSAHTLRATAATMRTAAAQTSTGHTQLVAEHRALNHAGAAGTAVERGLAALDRTAAPWDLTATEMLRTATVLERAGDLRSFLESWYQQHATTLKKFSDHSLLFGQLTSLANSLGHVIDMQCALEIARICSSPPPEDLDLTWLAAQYPDATVLKADGGGLIVAFGDVDKAETVTTFVAGTGSSNPAGWPGQVDRVAALSTHTGNSGKAATVLWLGYQAPPTLVGATAHSPARAGGGALRDFQKELTRRNPTARRTVIGYSYGTVVVGQAATQPLEADNVILVGSPGVPQKQASDFRLRDGGRVYAVTAPGDLIDLAAGAREGIHGRDPTAASFGAEVWQAQPGDHGSYWTDESTLAHIARVARE